MLKSVWSIHENEVGTSHLGLGWGSWKDGYLLWKMHCFGMVSCVPWVVANFHDLVSGILTFNPEFRLSIWNYNFQFFGYPDVEFLLQFWNVWENGLHQQPQLHSTSELNHGRLSQSTTYKKYLTLQHFTRSWLPTNIHVGSWSGTDGLRYSYLPTCTFHN